MPHFKMDDPQYGRQLPSWFSHREPEENEIAVFVLGGEDEDYSAPAAATLEMPPNYELFRHAHPCYRFEVVVKGELIATDGTILTAGDVMTAAPGEAYGPHRAGPEGCTTVEFFSHAEGMLRLYADGPDGLTEYDARKGELAPAYVPLKRMTMSAPSRDTWCGASPATGAGSGGADVGAG